ncbi:MAG: methylase [Nitrososphaerota archaeon]|nr:methylase [Nitrososphaerota archaeon]
MALMGRRVAVSIPDTVLEEKESPRDKTAKLGLIARTCAVYGVDLIEVFGDPAGHGEAGDICKVLEYLDTPQYLRRRLFPLDETLRFAGMLPPLRIPSHKPRVQFDAKLVGEFREGVANADGTVDIGLGVSPRVRGEASAGKRVTVRVSSVDPPMADVVSREQVGGYWGYAVEHKRLAEVFSDQRFRARVATSRLGTPLPEGLAKMRALLRGGEGVKLVFGSPSRGLFEMTGGDLRRKVDLVLNLFPGQQVETVRTEEALSAGLGLVNFVSADKA